MFDLSVLFKRFSGQVLTQNGPGGVFATNGIVGSDELPHGGSAITVFVAGGVAVGSSTERDASGNESRWEFVPQQMRKRRFVVTSLAVAVSAAVPDAVVGSLKGIRWLVAAVGACNR